MIIMIIRTIIMMMMMMVIMMTITITIVIIIGAEGVWHLKKIMSSCDVTLKI